MKLAAAALAALFLFMATLFGCETVKETAAPEGQTDAGASFKAYSEAKSEAFDSVATVFMYEPDIYIELELKFMAAGLADLAVMPIKAIGASNETLNTLESLGFAGVRAARDGEEYKITYKSKDGIQYTQTCFYDASLDALQSSVAGPDGKETVWFEYIKAADGYTAQYYLSESQFAWITAYLGADVKAFGVSESALRPPSLLLSSALGLDYVQKCDTYFILQGNNFDVFDNGETLMIKGRQ